MKSNVIIMSLLLTNIFGAIYSLANSQYILSIVNTLCSIYWAIKIIRNKRKESEK